MSYEVTLKRKGISFQVDPGQRVLDAALAQGVKLVYACRNGTCKTCVVKVLEGDIVNDPEKSPALFPFERARGLRLTCIGTCEGNVVIDR